MAKDKKQKKDISEKSNNQHKTKTKVKADLSSGYHFIPLGGSEQFGVNLNVYACDGKYLAVDCGIGFADERFPGVDILLPDPSFLEERADDLCGLIITHAHEDHIGAVAHLWEYLDCPIYCSPFTAEILHAKIKEKGLKKVPVHVVEPGGLVKLKPFNVEFLPVSHSVPDTCALAIETKYGRVLHSGDWNLDPKPVAGYKTEAKVFQAQGDKGILAYVGDSTNAGVPGVSGSEEDVAKGLAEVIKSCNSRVAVTMFASNIGRVISILKAATECDRKVAVVGRSLHRMISAAIKCGYMDGLPDFISEEDLGYLPNDKQLLIVTGSQGEPRAALSKISRGDHRDISLKRGDTVIFSARAIPGNERGINDVKNNLVAAGIHVLSPGDVSHTIHVSGHPAQEEITQMFSWLRPQSVIPVHGERMQLEAHAALAQKCQIKNTIIPSNGSVIRLAPGGVELVDHVQTGVLAVEDKRIIDSEHAAIRERRKLQYSGVIHVSMAVNPKGKVIGEPLMDTSGLFDVDIDHEDKMEERLYNEIYGLLDEMTKEELMDDQFMTEELRIGLRRLCYHLLGIKPKTTVHVIRV